ncbi:MAG: hypothetical protein JRJ75_10945 [Deltaproteobacteria bacterium]|nr:hypothetical protein [Deltaproteobacteria bacterium]
METYGKHPNMVRKGAERGWINKPHKIYHLEELIEPPVSIRKEKGKGAVRNKWFKTVAQLMKAKTLSDLTK